MDRKNRNRQNKKSNSGSPSDEYNLVNNFRKVNKNKQSECRQEYTTESSYNSSYNEGRSNMSDSDPLDSNTQSRIVSWEYTKLDDKLEDFSKTNNRDHTDLRIELEGKITSCKTDLEKKIDDFKAFSIKNPNIWIPLLSVVVTVGICIFDKSSISNMENKINEFDMEKIRYENKIKYMIDSLSMKINAIEIQMNSKNLRKK